jgi:hypothetical protein
MSIHNKLFGEQARSIAWSIAGGGNDKMARVRFLARVFECQARR